MLAALLGRGDDKHVYWRLLSDSLTGGNSWSIKEIEMYDVTAGGADLTAGGSVISSGSWSTEGGGFGPSKAFDGSTSGNSAATAGTNPAIGSVGIGYQFAAPVDIQRVRLFQHGASDRTVTAVRVQYSDDGTNFFDAWTATGLNDAGGIWEELIRS